jgi:Caspase domain
MSVTEEWLGNDRMMARNAVWHVYCRRVGIAVVWLVLTALTARPVDATEKPNVIASNVPRLALLIGNSTYAPLTVLSNPALDVRLMDGVLTGLGFKSVTHFDLNRRDLQAAIEAFAQRLKDSGRETVGLLYFAGHGVEAEGANYLVPVDADIRREDDTPRAALKVSAIAADLMAAGNQLNILILDACRNNPFKGRSRAGSGGRGLSYMSPVSGTFIASSTASGDEADDGMPGQNSPYAKALADALIRPGLTLDDVFKVVQRRIRDFAPRPQIPWVATSLESNFYFKPPAPEKSASAQLLEMALTEQSAALLNRVRERFPGTPEAQSAASAVAALVQRDAGRVRDQMAQSQYDFAARLRSLAALEDVARHYADTSWGQKAATDAQALLQEIAQTKGVEAGTQLRLKMLDAQRSLQAARELGTAEAYELVARLYPSTEAAVAALSAANKARSDSAKDMTGVLADALFQRAEVAQSAEAFEAIVALYPDAQTAPEAAKRAARLRDRVALAAKPKLTAGPGLVRAVQNGLTDRGCYAGPMSGAFDAATVAGLRAFARVSDARFYWHRETHAALAALSQGDRRCGGTVARSALAKCVRVRDESICQR